MNTLFIVSAILFVCIDAIYLTSISNYFNTQIIAIQGKPLQLDMYASILCYIFLTFGLYYFILQHKKPILDAFLFGLVVYMVFETTNKALFKKWSWLTVFIDGIWGGILFALTTFLTYKIQNYLV